MRFVVFGLWCLLLGLAILFIAPATGQQLGFGYLGPEFYKQPIYVQCAGAGIAALVIGWVLTYCLLGPLLALLFAGAQAVRGWFE